MTSSGAMLVNVSGNSVWASNKVNLYDAKRCWLGYGEIDYIQGNAEADITVAYEKNCSFSSSTPRPGYYVYRYNVNNGSFYQVDEHLYKLGADALYFTDTESLIAPPEKMSGRYSTNIHIFTALDRNNKAWVGYSGSKSETTGIHIGPASAPFATRGSASKDYLVFPTSTYEDEYGEIIRLSHFGSNKLIAHTESRVYENKKYVYKRYLLFYKKVNGIWTLEHAISRDDSGSFIPLNDRQSLYYSHDLYLITYE